MKNIDDDTTPLVFQDEYQELQQHVNLPDLEVENENLDINNLPIFIDDNLIPAVNNDDNLIHNVNNDSSFFINNRTTQSQKKSQKYLKSELTKLKWREANFCPEPQFLNFEPVPLPTEISKLKTPIDFLSYFFNDDLYSHINLNQLNIQFKKILTNP